MAGDWIKWVKGLIRKPEIIRAAGVLGRSCHDIAARWMELIEWADENVSEANRIPNSEDVLVKALTPAIIDDLVGLPEFARAMTSNGWLAVRSADMVFVNYFRHNAVSAKERALSANRSADKRRRDAERDVRHGVAVTREEKRREEKKEETPPTPLGGAIQFPASLDTPEFRQAWDEHAAYRRERHLPAWKSRTIDAQLKKFATWGVADAIAAMRETIAQGWSGVFPPKRPPPGKPPPANDLLPGQKPAW